MPEFTPHQERPADGGDAGRQGGHLMAAALKSAGVETVFGLCGGHILGLLDGCLEEEIRFIDTRHEGAAALAAEGWALATGETGVAAVTAGPGFANAMIGLLDAGAWSVPMVLFAGRTGLHLSGRGAVMDVDQQAIAAPAAKRTIRCVNTGRIPIAVADALHTARSGCPGPVYLEIPQDVFMARAEPPVDAQRAGFPQGLLAPSGSPDDLERALGAIEGAERPLVIAGSGTFWSGAGEELAAFAETAKVPVVTASAARGVIPDSHPWCLGTLIHAGVAAMNADVVIVLGSAFNANLSFGRAPLFSPEQTTIQVDIDPGRLGGNRRPDVAVVGDVGRVLAALTEGWRKTPQGRDEWLAQAREWSQNMRVFWDAQIERDGGGERLHAGAVVRELVDQTRELVGDGVTFVADGGDALTWALAYTYAEGPGRVLSTTTALGSLGVGVPFALAAQAARPDERTILFTGDGAFGLAAMEMDTAARHGLPIIVVVSNNHGWRDVSHEQDAWFGEGRRIGSDLAETRYDRLAEVLGGHGEHVTTLDEIGPALRRALDSGQPAVIDVATDPEVLSDLLRNVGDLGIM